MKKAARELRAAFLHLCGGLQLYHLGLPLHQG